MVLRRIRQVVVDLRGNGFGNAGAAALATALKQHANEHLTELDIGYNEIKDDGACAIAQVRCRKHCHSSSSTCSWHRPWPRIARLPRQTEAWGTSTAPGLHDTTSSAEVLGRSSGPQALKANPTGAPKELKINSNYITRFGQTALTEALDMVYEMGGNREIVITY